VMTTVESVLCVIPDDMCSFGITKLPVLAVLECSYDKVFIQASGLACEVYVEVSPLRSLPTTVCEI